MNFKKNKLFYSLYYYILLGLSTIITIITAFIFIVYNLNIDGLAFFLAIIVVPIAILILLIIYIFLCKKSLNFIKINRTKEAYIALIFLLIVNLFYIMPAFMAKQQSENKKKITLENKKIYDYLDKNIPNYDYCMKVEASFFKKCVEKIALEGNDINGCKELVKARINELPRYYNDIKQYHCEPIVQYIYMKKMELITENNLFSAVPEELKNYINAKIVYVDRFSVDMQDKRPFKVSLCQNKGLENIYMIEFNDHLGKSGVDYYNTNYKRLFLNVNEIVFNSCQTVAEYVFVD